MSERSRTTAVAAHGLIGVAFRRWFLRPEAPALTFLVALVVAFSLGIDGFWGTSNFESILTSVTVLGIIALAVNQVVLCGEIDISTGSMLGLCAMVAGTVATSYGGLILPLISAIAVGAAAGAVNGLLVTLGRVPAIIVTLGMLYALRGLILLVTGGSWVSAIPGESRVLGLAEVFGVAVPALILLGVFAVLELLSRHSVSGRDTFATGGNCQAARLAGLPVERTRFLAFLTVGIAVGLASIIYIGRTGSVQTNAGFGLELEVVAAVVVGGTSIAGGRGSMLAALTGAVLIGVILNGMILIGVPAIWQDVVLGALILLAVSADFLRRRFVEGK